MTAAERRERRKEDRERSDSSPSPRSPATPRFEDVDDILRGISRDDAWQNEPKSLGRYRAKAAELLPRDAVSKARARVREKTAWPRPEPMPDFDDISPHDARLLMTRTGYFRSREAVHFTWHRLWRQWRHVRRKRKRLAVKRIQDMRAVNRTKQPLASEVRSLCSTLLTSMKGTFTGEVWDVTRKQNRQDINYKSGMTHQTTSDLLQADLLAGVIKHRPGMTAWEEMVVELSDDDEMCRDLGRALGVPLVDVEAIFKEFQRFDKDGSGTMDREEFTAMLVSMHHGVEPTRTQLKNALDQIDENGDGNIDFPEFFCWYAANYLADLYHHGYK